MNSTDGVQFHLNPDLNSGNPLGMGVTANSAFRGLRTTAGDLLIDASSSMTVLTHTITDHVLFEDKTAVGVEADGKKFKSSSSFSLRQACRVI